MDYQVIMVGLSVTSVLFTAFGLFWKIPETIDQKVGQSELRINKRIDDLSTKIDQVDVRLSGRIDKLDSKIDKLDTKIDQVEQRLDAKINQVEQKLDTKIGNLGVKIDQVEEKLNSKIDRLQDSFTNIKIEVAKLEVYISGGRSSFLKQPPVSELPA